MEPLGILFGTMLTSRGLQNRYWDDFGWISTHFWESKWIKNRANIVPLFCIDSSTHFSSMFDRIWKDFESFFGTYEHDFGQEAILRFLQPLQCDMHTFDGPRIQIFMEIASKFDPQMNTKSGKPFCSILNSFFLQH